MALIDEGTLYKATIGVRCAMVGLDILLMITGTLLITVGAHINQHLSMSMAVQVSSLPKLWCMGIMPIAVGVLGIAVTLTKNRKLVLSRDKDLPSRHVYLPLEDTISASPALQNPVVLWVAISFVVVFGSYIFYVISGCLDPQRYGVYMQIYGDCIQDGSLCRCSWSRGSRSGVMEFSSCENIRHTTSLYLGLVALLVLCLTAVIISCVLGAVVGCCVHVCIPRDDDSLLHTSVYGANMRSRPSTASQSVYLPQYLLVPPTETTSMFTNERSVSVSV